jgi:hypothetical protein
MEKYNFKKCSVNIDGDQVALWIGDEGRRENRAPTLADIGCVFSSPYLCSDVIITAPGQNDLEMVVSYKRMESISTKNIPRKDYRRFSNVFVSKFAFLQFFKDLIIEKGGVTAFLNIVNCPAITEAYKSFINEFASRYSEETFDIVLGAPSTSKLYMDMYESVQTISEATFKSHTLLQKTDPKVNANAEMLDEAIRENIGWNESERARFRKFLNSKSKDKTIKIMIIDDLYYQGKTLRAIHGIMRKELMRKELALYEFNNVQFTAAYILRVVK